jgi:hypothetical protein
MDGITRIGLGNAGHDNGERATQSHIDDGYANPLFMPHCYDNSWHRLQKQ